MYEQVNKPKENKSRAIANTVAQKQSNAKQGFGFVDNRPEAMMQRKVQSMKDANVNMSTPVQFALDDDGRAYKAHVLDQDTPTWGSYVEANAIATARGRNGVRGEMGSSLLLTH